MTPRSLFNCILKILGIFFVKDILVGIPYLITGFITFSKVSHGDSQLWSLTGTLIPFLIYFLVCWLLIFRTNSVIDILKLDRNFDEEYLALNISGKTVILIGLIVTGGVIITIEIPNLCRHLTYYFQIRRLPYAETKTDMANIIVSGISMLIGFLLIGERKRIAAFIESHTTGSTADTGENRSDQAS